MPTARTAGFAFSFLVVALALPAIAGAADGALSVTVRDNFGIIPRAAVRATNTATGASQRVVTDDGGLARFAALPAGQYEVRATFPGFADAAEPTVALAEGEAKSLELVMGVAQLSTSLTVETPNRREQLLLDVAEPVTLIEKTQIQDTGARSAKDVLVEQNGSGIQVNAGGGQGYVSINGIPNKGVLVLVNGRRYLGQGREREPEPRGAAPARHPAHRGGEGRGLGALRVGRARRCRELHHRRADRARRHEHHHRLRRLLRRLPGGRRAVVARPPGRGEPRRRLPDLRRLRPRVLHPGAAGLDRLQAEPADDRPAPERLLERLRHRRLRDHEEGRGPLLRRLPAAGGPRLLLLRGDPARLHRLRLPARPDALHALAGGGLPALAPHERQRHLHLREVPARRDPRLRVRRARGAAAGLARVEPGGEGDGPPRLAGLRPRAPAAGRVRAPQREAAAGQPERDGGELHRRLHDPGVLRVRPGHQRPLGPAGAEPDLAPDAHRRACATTTTATSATSGAPRPRPSSPWPRSTACAAATATAFGPRTSASST